jgi:kynurenine 3-monooxygenase
MGRVAGRKVVVVGAGPVGCLSAISFARNGWDVELYEARPGELFV